MKEKTQEDASVKKNKLLRVITGIIISVISLSAIVLGSLPLLLLLIVIISLCSKEYVKILRHKGFHPSLTIILFSALAFAALTFFHRFNLVPSMLTLMIMASFLIVLFRGRQPYIVNVATTTLGTLYCGWLPCHLLLIRQIGLDRVGAFQFLPSKGLWLLLFVFIAVAITDIGAYYFGVKFGKHKLAEVISPKKTIEGAVGGGLCAILISCLGVFYTGLTLTEAILGGLLITLSAQLGDLSESLIKRDAGVKDSSDILPGHGGMLDRFDGYIFAIPVAYYYFMNFCYGQNVLVEFFKYLERFINAYF
ncbi:MAG: phosphatidate cytidylyltransferase [Candidatus Gastranaerophilales bacterium]|nr:phosphatidate cytidylyltransferase [Candidatus Gastranaerophilales bacterium]